TSRPVCPRQRSPTWPTAPSPASTCNRPPGASRIASPWWRRRNVSMPPPASAMKGPASSKLSSDSPPPRRRDRRGKKSYAPPRTALHLELTAERNDGQRREKPASAEGFVGARDDEDCRAPG